MDTASTSFLGLRQPGKDESLEAGRVLWREGDRGGEVVVLLCGAHLPETADANLYRAKESGRNRVVADTTAGRPQCRKP